MDGERTEKKRKFIIDVLYLVVIAALIYFLLKYVVRLLMPFLVALLIAMMLRPLAALLHRKLKKIPEKIVAAAVLTLFYALIAVFLAFLGFRLFAYLRDLFFHLPDFYRDVIEPAIAAVTGGAENLLARFDPEAPARLSGVVSKLTGGLEGAVGNLSVSAVSAVSGVAVSAPSFLLRVLITLIASYFILCDYEGIAAFVLRQLPEKRGEMLRETKRNLGAILLKYIRSYALILSITFGELFIGFLVIRQEHAFLLALLIAVFDILPIVGTGTVLVPWLIVDLIFGNYVHAIELAVMLGIIIVVRNTIEPKIIGKSVGLHPVVTLIAMTVGTALFGVIGLFGLPIACALLKDMNDKGKIRLFK